MTRILIFSLALLIGMATSGFAQKPKASASKPATTTASKSNAEKMGYARTTKYWGPGTFYCYAPGNPINKMANNAVSALRDLTGIWADDFYTEMGKQGFTEVPNKEMEKWFNRSKDKDLKFYYSPDKSYILQPSIKHLDRSPAMENGYGATVSVGMMRYSLLPKEDSLKVMEAIWQFLRDANEMKVILGSFGSTFKKADPKAYPIQQAGSSGWTSMRAGSFVLKMVDGKPKGYWERNEDIVRRTIGKPEFQLKALAMETDFGYGLTVDLEKEGYVLKYTVIAITLQDLEPGNTWQKEYPTKVKEYKMGVQGDKEAVNVYKKAPLPPVLEDLDKLLHLK